MILGKLVNLWLHWTSAFLNISPNWLMAPGFAFQRPVVVEIRNLKEFFDAPLSVIETETGCSVSQLKGQLIDIQLTPENFLKRRVKLPKMPDKHFTKAMEINLQKSSPIPVDQLTWRHGAKTSKDGSSATTQYIIKNDKLALLEQTIAMLGLRLRKITLIASNATFLDRSIRYDQPKRMWLLINLIAVLVFCGWAGFVNSNQLAGLQNANAVLKVQIVELQDLAVKHSKQLSLQKDASDIVRKTAAELNMGQNRTAMLEKLSGFFTDAVWLSELQVKGAIVSLGGFSTLDVASLVTDLKNEVWVSDARLLSAISGARASKSKRFQIQFELNTLNEAENE